MTDKLSKIAVLLPTRSRGDLLHKSLASLLDNACDLAHLHFVIGLDRDDQQGIDSFMSHTQGYLRDRNVRYTALTFDPMGYQNLNRYYNALAARAGADWLFVWNDDAVMETKHWDKEILKYDGQFRLLKVHTHNEHPYSIFPIVPYAWFEILGHLSEHQMIDAELSQSAFCLDIMQVIDVTVTHNQVELVNDTTDALGPKQRFEGNPHHPLDFHNREMTNRRFANMHKLAAHMQSQNVNVDFWKAVIAGKQDPWQRLKELDVNHQMVQIDPTAYTAKTQQAHTNV